MKGEPKQVHMKCRFKRDAGIENTCPGTEAIIVSVRDGRSMGFRHVTYRCTTCKNSWTVTL